VHGLEVAENQRKALTSARWRDIVLGMMTTRKILQIFGFETWRQNGQWIAHRPNRTIKADYLLQLIEEIVPEPPSRFTASALKAWGEECKAACGRNVPPELLAKAAFEAWGIDPPDEFIDCFISAWDDSQR